MDWPPFMSAHKVVNLPRGVLRLERWGILGTNIC